MKTATELADRLSHGYPSTERKEAAAMLLQQAEQIEALKAALNDAATSLNTISRLAGNEFYVFEDGERVETYMKHPEQIRGYAQSRYSAAIDTMKGKS